jgi:hypothetical protein
MIYQKFSRGKIPISPKILKVKISADNFAEKMYEKSAPGVIWITTVVSGPNSIIRLNVIRL